MEKTIVVKNDPLILNFYKMNNDRFYKNDQRLFFMIVFKKRSFKKLSLINLLTIVKKGLSLTIVKETVVYEKTIVFEKKLHATLSNVVLQEGKKL